ncbi:MAG TPA: PDZ domain-containing protein [Dokdonella sp.]|mgnify:CR=1 FL=1|uniref:S41 family peptidase n=1 Tax=Dokdonella sp. TaxID=2291710 RepID=UPI002BD883DE|nr:PDZ domain-containing protein [Dokdonella sp.]HOX70690.1 PDZ domain-containing protein [Dokdonella sp.]HPG93077.1 PDZ domain-containing protein [Dokdonella sp.]HPN79349.1 PDZ domain-containing protein [Dokdonella sp.]
MRLVIPVAVLAFGAASVAQAMPAGDSRLLRFPDICGDAIAFVQAGDIYTVAANGGTALRLTSHPGQELYPKFSPDCRTIAFSAEYDGTRQVHVIPASGGEPKQLTWYNDIGAQPVRGGTDYRVLDWTPDGRNVLVRANRVATDDRGGRPYLVPVDGGMEVPLAVPETGGGMLSPDGKTYVYTPIDREFRSWKRYRGGRAQDVWTYDLASNSTRRLTDNPATDNQPMWIGDTVYFTSDRNYTMNLFAMPAQGGEARQLTTFTDFDVLWPSAGKDAIVFENGGAIWRFDPKTEQAARVPIRVTGDFAQTVPGWKNVAGQVESFDLNADGTAYVFAARGELFRVSGKEPEIRNISRTPDARELGASLSPDGRTVAYLSDASGEYEIYLQDLAGGAPRQITRDGDVWRFAPVYSPDGRHLAYADKRQRLRIVDIARGSTRDVDTAHHDDITEYRWSPDGQWLAYTLESDAGLTRIWLYSLKDGSRTAVTEATSAASSPAFDPKGRWLYFLSSRDYNLQFSAFEQNYLYTNATRIYAVSLAAEGPFLYADAVATKSPADDAGPAKHEVSILHVEPQGMIGREQVLKAASGNYQRLQAGEDAVYFGANSGGRDENAFELRALALDADKEVTVARGLDDFRIAADGKHALVQYSGKFAVVEPKPDQDLAKATLDLSQMKMLIDPPREWRQEFVDGWRILRDWFYDPGVHGGIERWNAVRARYEPLVDYVASRQDLDYLFQELVGEVQSGHVYVQQGDQPKLERTPGGLLGAEIVADASGYFRIARIMPGANWDPRNRSPLTEPGVSIREGDFILAVDGVDARTVKNFYQLLQGKGGRKVTLRINSRADANGSREQRVETLTSELNLRYAGWVAARRALVDRLSAGRIGYIHLPNTAVDGNRELFRGMLAYADKDALIIDDRYNGGGFIPDRMVELLARKPLNYWKRRGLEPVATPMLSHNGPKAMLINGLSSSGGDALPYYFRKLGLGKLIGTRTWGGLIGISGNPSLADGGILLAATFRFMDTEGRWAIENEGVSPDIEVIDRPELLAGGRDPSVEKAVEELLRELAEHPPVKPVAPPAPTDFGAPSPR